jgi:hypothetical protein
MVDAFRRQEPKTVLTLLDEAIDALKNLKNTQQNGS